MSTYWNQERGQYENFENRLVELMTDIGDKLEEAAGDNINVVAGIRYDTDEQGLTDEQQGNARTNIGAAEASDVEGLLSNMTDVQGDVSDIKDDIGTTAMGTTATTLTGAIAEHEGDIGDINTAIGTTAMGTTATTLTGAIAEHQTEISGIMDVIGTAPETDGVYVLTCTVEDGAATFSWESAE